MQLAIHTFGSASNTLEVEPAMTVAQVKDLIYSTQQVPIACQKLVFNNQVLEDEQTVEACGLTDGSIVQLMFQNIVDNLPIKDFKQVLNNPQAIQDFQQIFNVPPEMLTMATDILNHMFDRV